jgi:hypothetical protein
MYHPPDIVAGSVGGGHKTIPVPSLVLSTAAVAIRGRGESRVRLQHRSVLGHMARKEPSVAAGRAPNAALGRGGIDRDDRVQLGTRGDHWLLVRLAARVISTWTSASIFRMQVLTSRGASLDRRKREKREY